MQDQIWDREPSGNSEENGFGMKADGGGEERGSREIFESVYPLPLLDYGRIVYKLFICCVIRGNLE